MFHIALGGRLATTSFHIFFYGDIRSCRFLPHIATDVDCHRMKPTVQLRLRWERTTVSIGDFPWFFQRFSIGPHINPHISPSQSIPWYYHSTAVTCPLYLYITYIYDITTTVIKPGHWESLIHWFSQLETATCFGDFQLRPLVPLIYVYFNGKMLTN